MVTTALELAKHGTDLLYIQVAREIAMEHYSLEEVLQRFKIDENQWDRMKSDARFTQLLDQFSAEWQSAMNTNERVKMKASSLVEFWLEEGAARLFDKTESLSAKTELLKVMTRLGGMGTDRAGIDGTTPEKFSVTINIGDKSINVARDITPKVIEGDML